ncbi:PAS domain S-box protein [Botrimarina sp.]|uniref:PAS domain S-box protein n=1 Tax=Botrimarina sp. TaxID=2795802 RepID=UPI0032ED8EDF
MNPVSQTPEAHPTDHDLTAWLRNELTVEQRGAVETHLERCDHCAKRLEHLPAGDDRFVERLREAAGLGPTAADPPADTNLAFAAIALQAGLIDPQQLADACVLFSTRAGVSLADLMQQQGILSEEARRSVDALLAARRERRRSTATTETLSGRDHGGPGIADNLVLAPLPGERLRLRQLHSQGGIGQVWRAHDTLLGREVAVKELLPELRGSRTHRDRFFREARVAAQLSHPGAVPVHEYREEGGRCYYTMKFLDGRSLSSVIRESLAEPPSPDDPAKTFERLFPLLECFLSVCDTISYAHAKGIVHRDLKGDNVVVGEFGEVNVIDWGLAKRYASGERVAEPAKRVVAESATLEGERLGTPGFMAPEQARGEQGAIDHRTDVYGLAALLYEVLTGRAPFSGETANEVMHRVEVQAPLPPSSYRPDTPRDLEAICLRGLSKDKADRQQSAAELADQVRHWVTAQAERRREALRREGFFALSRDLCVTIDPDWRIEQVNPAWTKMFGFAADRAAGKPVLKRVHPDDKEVITQCLRRVQQGDSAQDVVARIQNADGAYIPINWTLTRIAGQCDMYAIGRPLDERSERRRSLEARGQFFLLSPDLFVISDDTGRAGQVNPAWKAVLGYEPEEVVGHQFSDFVHPDDVARATRAGRRALLRESAVNLETRVRHRHDGYRVIAWTLCRVPGESINYAIGRDITESKRTEERLRALLDRGPEALAVVDSRGRIEYANQTLCGMLAYECGELIHEPFDKLLPESGRADGWKRFEAFLSAPRVRSVGRGQSVLALRSDGRSLRVRVRLSPLRLSYGDLSILVEVSRLDEPAPKLHTRPT